MFTGIIEEVGKVLSIRHGSHSAAITIAAKKVLEDVSLGDSIAVNGVCLTVVRFGATEFTADIMGETLKRSAFSTVKVGDMVHLERAMAADGRFGGHMVSGHIDAVGKIVSTKKDDIASIYTISAPASALKYIVEKGSIAIDGVSLTVVSVTERDFSVSLIPHTAQMTTLGKKVRGDLVNLETDILGKYVEKLLDQTKGGLSMETLQRNGFF